MKVAFAGTPEFAAAALEAILAAGFDVPLVLTQPDRPAGRGMQLQPSPVKRVALAAGIPVHQPEKLRTPEQQAPLAAVEADVLVVAAYGIIPAPGGARPAPPRLHQHPRLAAAALAGCRAHPPGDPGR